MGDTPQLGLLVMDDGREFGEAACAWAGAIVRSSVRVALAGAPDRTGIRTAAVVVPDQFTLETAVATAAQEDLFWILAPRNGSDALTRVMAAAVGAARVLDDDHPGFAVGFLDADFATATRIGAVADLRDPVTSGLSAWAAAGLALRLGADLDVLVLGADEQDTPPASTEEAMGRFEIRGAGWQRTRDAVDRAMSHGVTLRWVPLGSPSNRAAAILRAIDDRGYDIVVDDLPQINVGPRVGRRRRVQAALTQAGSASTAYRLLRDAPCGVVVVLDAVRMGLVPDELLKTGAAAALALGVIGASSAAAASTGVPLTAAMPQEVSATDAALAQVAEPVAFDATVMTAEDLAAMRHQLAETGAARDASFAHLVELQAQHGAVSAELAAVQAEQARVGLELEALQAAADEASSASTRMTLTTLGPLSLLPFTPSADEAEESRAAAEDAQAALEVVQSYADALDAQAADLEQRQDDLVVGITDVQAALAVQQAQVDVLSQQTADLAWTLNPVVIPVAGSDWTITAGFGDRGRHWSAGWHTGLDFAASTGTPILSAKSGTVVEAGWGGAYGNTIVVQHADGTSARYAHLQRIDVSVGQTVGVGEQIGTLGSTGNSTGPHLHFEVMDAAGNFIDPAAWLGMV